MAISIKDTKNVIFNAYKEAVAEMKLLEKQFKGKETEATKLAQELSACRDVNGEPEVIYRAPEINTLKGIIETLKSVEMGISNSFGESSSLQVVEAEKLEDLRKQIESEHKQIKALYNVEVGNGALAQLIEDYLVTQEEFELHFTEKQKQYKEERENKQSDWKKEQERYQEQIAERNREAATEQLRDAEEYEYQSEQERALEKDLYSQKSKQLEMQLSDLKAEKLEEWAAREKEVFNREEEFERYKTDYDGLAAKLEKEVKRAEGEAKGIIERDHKVKMKLMEMEVAGEQNALELRIGDLRLVIEKQTEQIRKLHQQLEETQRQAQTWAIKALEGSANNDSFVAVREIAIEQAKNMGKSK